MFSNALCFLGLTTQKRINKVEALWAIEKKNALEKEKILFSIIFVRAIDLKVIKT